LKSETPKEIVALYLPVIHAGYLDLLERHAQADVGVLGSDIIETVPYLRKEIRALTPERAAQLLTGIGRTALVISIPDLPNLSDTYDTVVMPNDDVSRELAPHFENVEYEPVFLRWDRENARVNQEVTPTRTIMADDTQAEPIVAALSEASRSTSWWRRVGAAVANDEGGLMLQAHNGAIPTPYSNWIDGDPRNTAKRGQDMELSNEMHAEARLIAEAARTGKSLEGSSIYVSTFPCPTCAKLIVESGISRCYFAEGYAVLDGEEIMKRAGIELIKIDGVQLEEDPRSLRSYPDR
jgi:dCMP deaminase